MTDDELVEKIAEIHCPGKCNWHMRLAMKILSVATPEIERRLLREAHKHAMNVGGQPGYRVIEDFASRRGISLEDE